MASPPGEYDVWLGATLRGRDVAPSEAEISRAGREWMAWAGNAFQGEAPSSPLDLNGTEAIAVLRAQFGPALQAAREADPNTARRLGRLPPSE